MSVGWVKVSPVSFPHSRYIEKWRDIHFIYIAFCDMSHRTCKCDPVLGDVLICRPVAILLPPQHQWKSLICLLSDFSSSSHLKPHYWVLFLLCLDPACHLSSPSHYLLPSHCHSLGPRFLLSSIQAGYKQFLPTFPASNFHVSHFHSAPTFYINLPDWSS